MTIPGWGVYLPTYLPAYLPTPKEHSSDAQIYGMADPCYDREWGTPDFNLLLRAATSHNCPETFNAFVFNMLRKLKLLLDMQHTIHTHIHTLEPPNRKANPGTEPNHPLSTETRPAEP